MIRYALQCIEGHGFESWFRDSDAFDGQVRRGHVTCPICQSTAVEKQIMAPAVALQEERPHGPPARPNDMIALGEREANLREALRHIRREIIANSDDVGERFPDEARRIHYGETDPRSIRGKASAEEARALHEEGVAFMPIPPLPDDSN